MPVVDALIEPGWIIPVEPHNVVLEDHVIAIKDGKILRILPQSQMNKLAFTADHHHKLPHHVVMPGLVNAHTHTPMTLLRGYADDIALMDWLNEHIWPIEKAFLNEDFVRDGSMLACLEMLLGGTTCFNDHYLYAPATAKVAQKLKMRCRIGMFMIDHETVYAKDFDAYVAREREWCQQYDRDPLINVSLAPHSPYALSDASLKGLLALQDELGYPIHMHVHESALEVTASLKQYHKRPIQRLADHGLLTPSFQAVHCAQLNAEDLAVFKANPVHVIHCPQANAKMASGICPVHQLQDLGLNVGLGTDGPASNNDLNMLGEIQSAAFLAKQQADDPARMPAAEAIRMATLNSARAMGLGDQIGSLEQGKAADIIALDMRHPATQPMYHPASQIAYAAGREQVSHVWINGRCLLNNRQLTEWDAAPIMERTREWGDKIRSHH